MLISVEKQLDATVDNDITSPADQSAPQVTEQQQEDELSTPPSDPPTRVVMGRQQDPESPAPQFRLVPTDKDGLVLKGRQASLSDSGEEPLDLDGVYYLNMEWKNRDRDKPCVRAETKNVVSDVCTHIMYLELYRLCNDSNMEA